jgi:hypothetical protein
LGLRFILVTRATWRIVQTVSFRSATSCLLSCLSVRFPVYAARHTSLFPKGETGRGFRKRSLLLSDILRKSEMWVASFAYHTCHAPMPQGVCTPFGTVARLHVTPPRRQHDGYHCIEFLRAPIFVASRFSARLDYRHRHSFKRASGRPSQESYRCLRASARVPRLM